MMNQHWETILSTIWKAISKQKAEDTNEPEDNRCGTILESAWLRQSKALRTDTALVGCMCSPHPEIMEDCSVNNKGEHQLPVLTRLLRKLYSHMVVRIFLYLFIS